MIGESSLADGSDSKVLDPTLESSTNCGIRCECGALVSSIPPSLQAGIALDPEESVFEASAYRVRLELFADEMGGVRLLTPG